MVTIEQKHKVGKTDVTQTVVVNIHPSTGAKQCGNHHVKDKHKHKTCHKKEKKKKKEKMTKGEEFALLTSIGQGTSGGAVYDPVNQIWNYNPQILPKQSTDRPILPGPPEPQPHPKPTPPKPKPSGAIPKRRVVLTKTQIEHYRLKLERFKKEFEKKKIKIKEAIAEIKDGKVDEGLEKLKKLLPKKEFKELLEEVKPSKDVTSALKNLQKAIEKEDFSLAKKSVKSLLKSFKDTPEDKKRLENVREKIDAKSWSDIKIPDLKKIDFSALKKFSKKAIKNIKKIAKQEFVEDLNQGVDMQPLLADDFESSDKVLEFVEATNKVAQEIEMTHVKSLIEKYHLKTGELPDIAKTVELRAQYDADHGQPIRGKMDDEFGGYGEEATKDIHKKATDELKDTMKYDNAKRREFRKKYSKTYTYDKDVPVVEDVPPTDKKNVSKDPRQRRKKPSDKLKVKNKALKRRQKELEQRGMPALTPEEVEQFLEREETPTPKKKWGWEPKTLYGENKNYSTLEDLHAKGDYDPIYLKNAKTGDEMIIKDNVEITPNKETNHGNDPRTQADRWKASGDWIEQTPEVVHANTGTNERVKTAVDSRTVPSINTSDTTGTITLPKVEKLDLKDAVKRGLKESLTGKQAAKEAGKGLIFGAIGELASDIFDPKAATQAKDTDTRTEWEKYRHEAESGGVAGGFMGPTFAASGATAGVVGLGVHEGMEKLFGKGHVSEFSADVLASGASGATFGLGAGVEGALVGGIIGTAIGIGEGVLDETKFGQSIKDTASKDWAWLKSKL